jgi:hypothetical protein
MEILFWVLLVCFISALAFVAGCMVGVWWSKQEEMREEE